MFGYVLPSQARLNAEEKERFRAVYCGLCHTLGRRYGFAARFLLNYDFTFLAILLSDGGEETCRVRRCAVHPCRGCRAQESTPALEEAADRSVVLGWWQLQDHIADHGFFGSLKYRAAVLPLRRAYRTASGRLPDFDASVREHLHALAVLEAERCASIDRAAEPFAALMADMAAGISNERRRRVLEQILYHLGRWIYLIDAADDFTKDAKSGNYNPLRCRYAIEGEYMSDADKFAVAETLDASIDRMASAYALIDYGVWTPILNSIFYESLYGIGKAVLDGNYRCRRRTSCQKSNAHEETL